ncbi:MAG: DUF3536 domain-containing protein [Candidatus Omnitrophota bacterium]|nr:DUF3536 domain-containing protein [Candidatus Omnitrophota bacterium]
MKPVYVCLHGHFYQPPRENAWVEIIERQESAKPFHDWNERIYSECYVANSRARIFNDAGKIVDIVNNFEKMSFNIGPTLMSWLEDKHPKTYQRVVEADRVSADAHHGHGNAIAQVYNHMIMPLANGRDRVTQVRWGIADFRHRFGRAPEGIWLPETACNDETLEVLVDEGLKFTILSPHQAKAVSLDGKDEIEWHDVSTGGIDPRQAYRYKLKNDPNRSISLFFYDGPISHAVGFENILSDAKQFMDRIEGAVAKNATSTQFIHVATDGETYGHHKAFGEQALAYFLSVEAPERGYHVSNYGAFLARHPPKNTVKLKEGEDGEGTAWSCAHGVKRWKDDCGCATGARAGWNQKWRKPLRDSLNSLRDRLAKLYESGGSEYLGDVWKARDEYIEVILDRSEATIESFLGRHQKKKLNPDERSVCLKLLEMQRHSMLMYTSCGWFFSDISGIETIQILQYAARAMQLAHEVSGIDYEADFLAFLEKAESNLRLWGSGRDVYESLVRPSVASLEHIVSYYAIGSLFKDYYPSEDSLDNRCAYLNVSNIRRETLGEMTVQLGRARIHSRVTLEEKSLIFFVIQMGLHDFRCYVKSDTGGECFEAIEKDIFTGIDHAAALELLEKVDAQFGENHFRLKDLLLEDRMKIISLVTREQMEKVSQFYETIYDENRRMNMMYRSIRLPIPPEFRYVAEHVLGKRFMGAVRKIAVDGFNLKKVDSAFEIVEAANKFHINMDKTSAALFLSEELGNRMKTFVEEPRADLVTECLNIHGLAERLGISLRQRQAQDDLFFLLKRWRSGAQSIPEWIFSSYDHFLKLMDVMQLATEDFRKLFSPSHTV